METVINIDTLACPECGQSFSHNIRGLHTHRRSVHGKTNDEFHAALKEFSKSTRREYGAKYRAGKRAERMSAMQEETKVGTKAERRSEVRAHFCPNCGTNIDAVQMALKMTSH